MRWAILLLCVGALGCGKPEPPKPVPMGAAAPEFGSAPPYDTLEGFLTGYWSPGFGPSEDAEYSEYWEFRADGTFVFSKFGSKHKFEGTWKPSGKGVWLTYETYDGDTLQALRERMQKEAESGTQGGILTEDAMSRTLSQIQKQVYIEVSGDKKELFFTDPGAGDYMYEGGGGGLVRMKVVLEAS